MVADARGRGAEAFLDGGTNPLSRPIFYLPPNVVMCVAELGIPELQREAHAGARGGAFIPSITTFFLALIMLGFVVLLPQRPWEQHLHQRRRVGASAAPTWGAAARQRLGTYPAPTHCRCAAGWKIKKIAVPWFPDGGEWVGAWIGLVAGGIDGA